jgi:hypothetical protein
VEDAVVDFTGVLDPEGDSPLFECAGTGVCAAADTA